METFRQPLTGVWIVLSACATIQSTDLGLEACYGVVIHVTDCDQQFDKSMIKAPRGCCIAAKSNNLFSSLDIFFLDNDRNRWRQDLNISKRNQ